jgi:hypothetical protein
MKKILTSVMIAWISCSAWAQSSSVILSELKVSALVDVSAKGKSTFVIHLSVNEPKNLGYLEIAFQDRLGNPIGSTTSLFTRVKEGKVEIVFDDFTVPFQNSSVDFMLQVSDHIKLAEHMMRVTGHDKTNQVSNTLIYDPLHQTH